MGGAPSLPTASTPGYTTFRGFVACDCLAQWLPVYERLLKAKGLIKNSIDVWQLTGGAPASGGTHTQGGAYDLLYQTGPEEIACAREMGSGSWGRTVAQGFSKPHQHGCLYGCPHNSPALYQYTAMRNGYNGLGQATSGRFAGMWGYGHLDEYPKPSAWRTWKQGIAWAEVEIARLAKPAASAAAAPARKPQPAPAKEADMQFTDKIPGRNENVGQALARALWAYDQIIDGGSIDRRIDSAVAALAELRVAVAKGETEVAQSILDRIVVDLSVKPAPAPQ